MKKNILTLAFASLAILVAGSSCSKDFETVLNKERSTDTDISKYLPEVTRGSVNLGTFNLLISTVLADIFVVCLINIDSLVVIMIT